MFKKVFLDATILVDSMDTQRNRHLFSTKAIRFCLNNRISLYTSCNIAMGGYYLSANVDKKRELYEILIINQFCTMIDFTNKEVELTCHVMQNDTRCHNLEDTLQYILAKKAECDFIISNDHNFVSLDIELMSSNILCEKIE